MSILSSPGFSLAYYLFTFFALEAAFVIAFGHWRRNLAFKARRIAIAFGILGIFWLVFLLVFATWPGVSQMAVELTLAVVSMGFLVWAFSPDLINRVNVAAILLAGNTILALLVFGLTFIPAVGSLTVIFLLWQIVMALFLLTTQLRNFASDQTLTVTAVFVLLIGAVLQLVLGGPFFPELTIPIFVRLSQMVAYPLLVVAVYQEVIDSYNMQSQALKNLSETSSEKIEGLISLFEATRNVISSLDLAEVVDGAAKGVVEAIGVDLAGIALPEEGDPMLLRMVAVYNPHREGRGEAITFPITEQQAIKHAVERLRPVDMNTGYDSPQIKFLFAMLGARNKIGPLIIQPLVLQDKPVGVLIVGNPYSKRPISPTEAQLAHTMAYQIAIAIDNARTYKQLYTKSQQLAWTLRNHEQDAGRRRAALEAELKKSREETTIISQRLYEQETLARKSQKELTDYQQHISHLNKQYKAVYTKLEKVVTENQRLAVVSATQKRNLEEVERAEAELQALRQQVETLQLEANEVDKLRAALEANQLRNRKLAKALRTSKSKMEQMANMPAALTNLQSGTPLENLFCGVLISDSTGKISKTNKVAAELLNKDSEALLGTTLVEAIPAAGWSQAVERLSNNPESLISATLQLDNKAIKATISPITDTDSNQVGGNIVIFYDATDEYENQQARDEFVASLAQELRTPMTSIIGYIGLLLGESVGMVTDMQRKFLQRTEANIERMESLLNDLIGIAAIDAGQMEINPTTIDMAEIIEDAIIGAKAQLEEKQIQLLLDLPGQIPPVEADPGCIQQVMTNLLGNATKITPAGGTIQVTGKISEGKDLAFVSLNGNDEERWLKISISDQGGGIADKDSSRVFERFYKAEHALIQGLGETGVGLSIVKYLIEAHGGEVWFNSEMGAGTTFHFALPLQDYFDDPWEEIDVPPLDLNSDL